MKSAGIISRALVFIDSKADYVPFLSAVTNVVDLVAKGCIAIYVRVSGNNDLSIYYFQHLQKKSIGRCMVAIFLPFLGNAGLVIYDICKYRKAIALQKDFNERRGVIESFFAEIPDAAWKDLQEMEYSGYASDFLIQRCKNKKIVLLKRADKGWLTWCIRVDLTQKKSDVETQSHPPPIKNAWIAICAGYPLPSSSDLEIMTIWYDSSGKDGTMFLYKEFVNQVAEKKISLTELIAQLTLGQSFNFKHTSGHRWNISPARD